MRNLKAIITAMSREHVDLIRSYFATWNESGLEGTASFRHPHVEVHDPPDMPDADQYVGEAAARTRVEGYMEAGWDGIFRDVELFDAGEEVLAVVRLAGTSPIGGVSLEATVCQLFLVEDGKISRIRQFLRREEGMAAAGLET